MIEGKSVEAAFDWESSMNDPKEIERMRQQAVIDWHWEQQRLEKELKRKRDEEKAFHRGPQDDDWEFVR
jgi:hypothetical protein